ncbi:CDC20 [Acanthosepion pharaonis]|uniref:CDC20 n=1 Tax=Acanthosepion pharaonis TaxID=158019 RepID=A0A812CLR0_ACAPH|nr:CDC20 [Sepia pharaonis]
MANLHLTAILNTVKQDEKWKLPLQNNTLHLPKVLKSSHSVRHHSSSGRCSITTPKSKFKSPSSSTLYLGTPLRTAKSTPRKRSRDKTPKTPSESFDRLEFELLNSNFCTYIPSYTFPPIHSLLYIPSYTFPPIHSLLYIPSHSLLYIPSYTFPPIHSLLYIPSYTFPPIHSLLYIPSYTFPPIHSLLYIPSYKFPPPPIHSLLYIPSHTFPPIHSLLYIPSIPTFPPYIPSHTFPPIHSLLYIPSYTFPPISLLIPSHTFPPIHSLLYIPSYTFPPIHSLKPIGYHLCKFLFFFFFFFFFYLTSLQTCRKSLEELYISENKERQKSSFRHIYPHPDRILDAPDLIDNFYLNLLDWSSKNTMCVALCYSCHLLEMDRSSVHELINGENIQDDYISCLSFDDVGNYIGVGDNGGNLQLWDVQYRKMLRTMSGHYSSLHSLSWNANIITCGTYDGCIYHHDVRLPQHCVGTLYGHSSIVCGLTWSPDGLHLASGGNDNLVNVWDLRQGPSVQPLHSFASHTAAIKREEVTESSRHPLLSETIADCHGHKIPPLSC